MPINFELTFTQPLLTQLDTGQAKGSKDMAKFITDNYVRTMLTGLPAGGGIVPVLPAPGLSTPAGPPPFPIPMVPINNFVSRQRAMQRILQTYFEAREVLIMQGTIKSMIKSIALLVRKSHTLYKQVDSLLKQVAQIQKQLIELPQMLEDVKDGLIEVIENERNKLEVLFQGLDQFRLQYDGTQFDLIFANELRAINTIRNFKVTLNIADYQGLIDLLDASAAIVNALPSDEDGTDVDMFKRNLYQQIKGSLTVVITLANSFVNPSEYIGYIKGLSEFDVKLRPVLDVLYRYDFIRRMLEPKLIKLKRKVREKLTDLRVKIQTRINDEKKKLRDKLKALAEKRQGQGKRSLYLKAGKIVAQYKKKYLTKIKKIKNTISDVRTVIGATQRLIADTTQLKNDIENFATTGIQKYIEQIQVDVKNTTTPQYSTGFVQNELNRIYDQIGLTNPILRDALSKQLVGKVTSPTVFLDYLQSKPLDLLVITQRFRGILYDLDSLIRAVQRLFNDKPKNGATVGNANVLPLVFLQKEPTVGDVLLGVTKTMEEQLNRIDKKLREFIEKQRLRFNKAIQRIKEDAEMKLIMLVPLKSDLKDGKTKAEIIKAKKDKVKTTKNKIKKTVKKLAIISSKVIPGATNLARNLNSGKWLYSENQGSINKLVDGIYDLKIMDSSDSEKKLLNQRRQKTKNDISDYLFGFELLVGLLQRITDEMSSTDFLRVFGEKLKQRTIQGHIDLYNKVKQIPSLKKAKPITIVNFFLDTYAFRALDSTYVRTVLADCEKAYFNESRAFLQQFGKNPLLQRLFPGLDVGIDIMLVKLFEGIGYIAQKVSEFVEKLYIRTVKPLVDLVNKKLKKIKEDVEAWLKEHVVKRALNLDLKLMSIAFNLATRAFWTGFNWLTPNGVKYTCLSIGPFIPLLTKPDDGPSMLVREISKNLYTQLNLMSGLVSPPPPTGIPPFPFVAYA